MIKLKDLLTESELGPKDPATNKLWRGVLYLVADIRRATTIDTVARKKVEQLLLKASKELENTQGWAREGVSRNEGGPGSGKRRGGPKLQEPWKDPAEPVKNRSKMPRKSRSKEQDPTRRQVRSTKGKHAPKLKQFGESKSDPSKGQSMTPEEKKRTRARLHKFDRPQLVDLLRRAADAANRGNAKANDFAYIYRDELNSRDKGYGGV